MPGLVKTNGVNGSTSLHETVGYQNFGDDIIRPAGMPSETLGVCIGGKENNAVSNQRNIMNQLVSLSGR